MKKQVSFLAFILLLSIQAFSQDTITFTWQGGAGKSFHIETTTFANGITLDWGDGSTQTFYENSGINHSYADTLNYRVTITTTNKNIIYFNIKMKEVSALDVSNCTALKQLYCSGNPIKTLNASNTAITSHDIWRLYTLESLDVSNCSALTSLDCSYNLLTFLDASNCSALTELSCSYNRLTFFDASNCSALTELSCYNNRLTTLNVNNCSALARLDCAENPLKTLNASNTAFNTLDVSQLSTLENLDVSNCTKLTSLNCVGNPLKTINASNTSFTTLDFSQLRTLENLDVSNCSALKTLYCSKNLLTSLDVSTCPALTELYCSYNLLTILDVSNCSKLTTLYCNDNQLTTLDASTCSELTNICCLNNALPLSQLKPFSDAISNTSYKQLGLQTLPLRTVIINKPQSLAGEMMIDGTQTTFVVTLDSTQATEGTDYTLDYTNQTITFHTHGDYELTLTNTSISSSYFYPAKVVMSYRTREIQTDATLESLSVSTGTLSPAFSSETTLYNVNVAYETEEITISATPADANASIEGTGTIKLDVGENPCMVIVTAEDGTTIKAYAVVVTRAKKVGIEHIPTNQQPLTVYPNPTKGKLRITNYESGNGNLIQSIENVEVYDINGKKLSTINTKHSTQTPQEVDLSRFAKGIYILRINNEQTVKVVKE